ncbi:MAG: hypothetical protein MZU91_01740 [Desulfosudis oleivorans]|nr:hypothetical protein [Desulfosudis oleivorans]
MPKIVPMMKSLNLPPMLRVIPIEETVENLHEGAGCRLGPADSPRRIAHLRPSPARAAPRQSAWAGQGLHQHPRV